MKWRMFEVAISKAVKGLTHKKTPNFLLFMRRWGVDGALHHDSVRTWTDAEFQKSSAYLEHFLLLTESKVEMASGELLHL